MNGYVPDGYVPTQEAIARALEYWFAERIAALKRAIAPQSETKPDISLDTLVRTLSRALLPDALRQEFVDIAVQTVHRLRDDLHQGKQLKAFYFGGLFDNSRQTVSREYWATAQADGVMKSGTYWPFGKPPRWNKSRPNYSLFLLQSELDALLINEPTARKPLPPGKISDLVKALRTLDHLNRVNQRKAVRDMPEFRRYHITDDIFSEAARQAPRKAGHKLPKRD